LELLSQEKQLEVMQLALQWSASAFRSFKPLIGSAYEVRSMNITRLARQIPDEYKEKDFYYFAYGEE
jgi:hypothetical protein